MKPTLLQVFRNAELNFRNDAKLESIARADMLNDVSNEAYFEALMRATALQDPVMQRQPERPQLGMDWSWRLHRERLDEVIPMLHNPAEVRRYSKADIRALCRAAGVPLRFQLSLQKAVRFAAAFDDLVKSDNVHSFHSLVSQSIHLEGRWAQPDLRVWLKQTFNGIEEGSVDRFINTMGLGRGATPTSIALLQTVGVIDGCSASNSPTDEAREATLRACQSLVTETGNAFAYVDRIFASNFTWSRVTAKRFDFQQASVCTFDDPMCGVCAHAPYCERRGVQNILANKETGWLAAYAPQWTLDEKGVFPLKYLPGLALDAVYQEIADSNSMWWRAYTVYLDDAEAGEVRAVMTYMPTSAVRAIVGERSYLRSETQYAKEAVPDVCRNLPLLLASAGEGLYGLRGEGLLLAYEEAGVQEVPVLAVDWGQVGALLRKHN